MLVVKNKSISETPGFPEKAVKVGDQSYLHVNSSRKNYIVLTLSRGCKPRIERTLNNTNTTTQANKQWFPQHPVVNLT